MKISKVLKHILACSLVSVLTVSEVSAAFGAEINGLESETETVEVVEAATETETSEQELLDAETIAPKQEAVPSLGEQNADLPTITQPTISAEWYSSWVDFYISYSGADYEACELTVTASGTGSVVYSDPYYYGDNIDSDSFYDSKTGLYDVAPGVTYTFTLKPFENRDIYDEEADEYHSEKVYGAEKAVRWTAPTVEAVSALAVKEMTPSGFVFSHSAVSEGASVRYQYSKSATFNENAAEVNDTSSDTLYYSLLEPAQTYYVRAYVARYGMKGSFSNVVSVTAPVAETFIETEITNTGVTLSLEAVYGDYTGFQIFRKEGKGKYKKLTTTTNSIFADSGLKKDTKYTYKVCAYYYNADTKKNIYGEYAFKTVTTGAAVLNLKADASGKTAIKLKWNKISSASGYDIYRYAGTSESHTFKSGVNNDFSKYELIKSLGKKKTSFTNKKLTAGESYGYVVKAYKLVKGKKQYFTEAYASATTKFSFSTKVDVYKQVRNPGNGTVKISWKQIPQANGYLIEKYDSASSSWVVQARITKAKTTSYTLPASPLGKTTEYRIRAYKGSKYSHETEISVTGHIAVVTGVTAKSAGNGVTVSWKPVAGASFYKVYRTTNSAIMYNADIKVYDYANSSSVMPKVFKTANITDSYYYTLGNSAVKMQWDSEATDKLLYHMPGKTGAYASDAIVGTSVTDYAYAYHSPILGPNGIATGEKVRTNGPKSDVQYYYYVIAYTAQKDPASDYYTIASSYGSSKSAPVSLAGSAALKAPTVSVKAGSKSATLTIKKVTGAKEYAIYRASSKKGAYEFVGTTTKTKYKDKKLTSKKTYYYKVKAVSTNSLGADSYSAFSKVKSVKAK